MNQDNSILVFPQPIIENQGRIDNSSDYGVGGITFKQYLIAKAMQSLIPIHHNGGISLFENHVAHQAVIYAESILKEMEK